MIDNPITRKEKYLAKLTGSYTGNVPDPITRVEKYLYDLCQKGISGLTPEEIENAVNKYLEGKDYVTKTDADKLYQPAGSYLSGTDEDLAVSGKAADAKAVGNAVAKIEGINYTNRGTLADTDAFLINDGTGMKKSVLSKLSDFVLDKIADKVFAKLQTNDKTILGAINELNSNRFKANSYTISSGSSTKTVNVKWNDANDHMTSFLLIDSNLITSAYITGRTSGVVEISKESRYAPPVLDASSVTLKVTLIPWSAALLICLNPVTIS